MYCSCILSTWNKLLLGVVVYWMTWYCYSFRHGFKCIFQLYSNFRIYGNLDISCMYHCALIIGCAFFWCWVSWCIPFTNSSIEFYLIMIVVPIIAILGLFFSILNHTFSPFVSKLFWFCKNALLFQYRIEHVTLGFLHVRFRFSAGVLYRGVPRFATDCPYGVWRCELTTGLPFVGPIF